MTDDKMSILMFMCLDSGRHTTWLCRTYGMRLFCRWDVPVSIAAVSFVYLWKKIQWIVCIIAILTNKCLWFTIISNIKWKKHFVWFFSFFIFSCLFKVFHVGFEFCSKAKFFFCPFAFMSGAIIFTYSVWGLCIVFTVSFVTVNFRFDQQKLL